MNIVKLTFTVSDDGRFAHSLRVYSMLWVKSYEMIFYWDVIGGRVMKTTQLDTKSETMQIKVSGKPVTLHFSPKDRNSV